MMSAHEIPNAELDVMRCLWQGQPRTARAIREQLHPERNMSHSSVCTLLGRLEAKGFVAREKGAHGKAFVYRATVAMSPTKSRLVGALLDRLFAGSGIDLVASLFESQPPTDQQLNEFQRLLDELRSRSHRNHLR
jgi:BlaI family transcriptional regulator, penicillinase repressor